MNNKFELINWFIDKLEITSYCELGIGVSRETFNNIKCDFKFGVDNYYLTTPDFIGTTDEFFDGAWDIGIHDFQCYFIDAYHEKSQVIRDFDNCRNTLSEHGIIFMHDIGPVHKKDTLMTASGDAYLAWIQLKHMYPFDDFYSYEFPNGDVIGIVIPHIHNEYDKIENIEEYDWNYYQQNRDEILNKKTLEELYVILEHEFNRK